MNDTDDTITVNNSILDGERLRMRVKHRREVDAISYLTDIGVKAQQAADNGETFMNGNALRDATEQGHNRAALRALNSIDTRARDAARMGRSSTRWTSCAMNDAANELFIDQLRKNHSFERIFIQRHNNTLTVDLWWDKPVVHTVIPTGGDADEIFVNVMELVHHARSNERHEVALLLPRDNPEDTAEVISRLLQDLRFRTIIVTEKSGEDTVGLELVF